MNRKGFLKSIGALFGAVALAPYIPKMPKLKFAQSTPSDAELMTAECRSNFEGGWHLYAATSDGKYYRDGIRVTKDKCLIEFRSPTQINFGNMAMFDTEEGMSWDAEIDSLFIKGEDRG